MNELTIAEELRRETDGLEPPTADLVARSIVRGRTLVRRRRIGQGAAALSVAAVVGAGALVVTPMLDNAPAPQAIVPAASGASASSGALARVVEHGYGVPADQMAATLASLLPDGAKTDLKNWSETPRSRADQLRQLKIVNGKVVRLRHNELTPLHVIGIGFQAARLLFDDGHGVSSVGVLIQPSMPDREAGTIISSAAMPEYSDARQSTEGVVSNVVTYHSPTGFDISLTAYNAPAEKGQQHTRALPPLTVRQLAAIAKNAVWVK